jgi:hypothetical protein
VRIPDWDGVVIPASAPLPRPKMRTVNVEALRANRKAPRRTDLDQLAAVIHDNPGQIFEVPSMNYDYFEGEAAPHYSLARGGSLGVRGIMSRSINGRVYMAAAGSVPDEVWYPEGNGNE